LQLQRESLEKQRASLAKQREAVHHQLGSKQDGSLTATAFISPIPALIQADCSALAAQEAEDLISDAATKQSLAPALIRAVMRQESGFKPCAVSVKGAQGLMQLMPATADQFHVSDPFDPKQNVDAGAALLKQLLDRYKGDLRLALVAYNAGANRADNIDAQGYPAETQRYIANIFAELGLPVSEEAPSSGDKQTSSAASDSDQTDNPAPPKNGQLP
jgi:soluble lytic murein transglycosylase-like protein